MFRKERRKHDHGEFLGAPFSDRQLDDWKLFPSPNLSDGNICKFDGPSDSWKSARCRLSAWLRWTPHSAASWTCDPTR